MGSDGKQCGLAHIPPKMHIESGCRGETRNSLTSMTICHDVCTNEASATACSFMDGIWIIPAFVTSDSVPETLRESARH
jgi:hypothetical protein